jgi:histidine ammonia-lyase
MGANAARHCREVVANVHHIVAIELLTAAQAVDLRPDGPARLGRGTVAAYRAVRERVRFLPHDRETAPDIEALTQMLHEGRLLSAVRDALGDTAP